MKSLMKLALCLLVIASSSVPWAAPQGNRSMAPGIDSRPAPQLRADLGRMPLAFIANQGQIDRRAEYYIAGKDKGIFFTSEGLTFALGRNRAPKDPDASGRIADAAHPARSAQQGQAGSRWNAKLDFVGANPGVHPEGEAKTETAFSFFRGRPRDWRTGVPAYFRLVYPDLWPGIDLVYSGTSERLKYEFIVRPGADPSRIRLAYRGISGLVVDAKGRLHVETPAGGFRDETPVAYQVIEGENAVVPVTFRLEGPEGAGGGEEVRAEPASASFGYGFDVGDYDRSRPLVLDPATIVYCGFIGSAADDRGNAVAIDASGNAYVTGFAGFYDFPVTVGPDLSFNSATGGTDAFVAKVNAAGTGLVYCGFIGGSADDVGKGIAVDASGNAYVTGWTFSQDFPAVVGPGLSAHGNITQYSDAFVAKVSASGTSLAYCGFVGGSSSEQGSGVAVDDAGNAYLAGWTESVDFATTTGPDLSFNGGRDAFVAKVNAAGTAFVYAGFIGGQVDDAATAIAVDGSGNAYITGYTDSTAAEGFPVRNGPSLTYTGNQDAFVAKVDYDGTRLDYCGYIGGTDIDAGSGIAVDASGSAYVVGTSDSRFQFPVKGGPDLVHHDGDDAFVAKVSPSGAALVYCGFIGGSGDDQGNAIAVDTSGIAYIAGSTDSASDFPLAGGPYLVEAGLVDAFVATVSATGDRLIYCGYLGGSQNDAGNGIAADGAGNVFVTGYTHSGDFPVAVGPILTPGGGLPGASDDAFIARISEELPPLAPTSLHATAATVTEIDLAWTDRSTNETGFKIERKNATVATWSEVHAVGPDVTSYADTGLAEATPYNYRVRATNAVGDSGYSNEILAYTLPAAPMDLTATAINERRVDLAWADHSAGESGFRIEKKVGVAGSWTAINLVAPDVTTYSDTNVVESTTYSYRVYAYDNGGDSDPTNVASATTPALSIPIAPSNAVATALSATSARLTWTDNSYNEDGFRVERKTGAGGTWAVVFTAGANSGAGWVDSSLTESATYYYRVRAYNSAGDSGYSNEAPVTTPANQPLLRLPVADIAFGSVNECAASDMTTTLHNDGGATLTVSSIGLASGSTDFTYRGPATPFNIAPFASQAITVRYAPLVSGAEVGVLAVHSNDSANPSVTFNVSGSGFVPAIGLSLQVQRQVERAWIIRREYGRITLTVTKSAPFNVTTYRLSRRAGTGAYVTIKEFTEADLPTGTVTYIDMFLAAGTSYAYKVEALNCAGAVLAVSGETGAGGIREPATRRETRPVKR